VAAGVPALRQPKARRPRQTDLRVIPNTPRRIKRFQRRHDLPVTGEIGKRTRRKLRRVHATFAAPKPARGKRSSKPRLTRAQRTIAAENANPLYNPAVQLGGHALISSARQLADLELAPQVGALNRQLTSTTTQGTALAQRGGDYYRQLVEQEMKGLANQRALSSMLNTATGDVGVQTQAAYSQMANDAATRAAQDAQLRGPGLGGGGQEQVQGEIANQQGVANLMQAQGAQTAAQQGANWEGLAGLTAQTTAARGGEIQGQLLNRLANQQADIRGRRADVEGTRGELTTKALTGLRQSSFENLITQAGLDIKQKDIEAQMAGVRQQAASARQRTKLDTRKFKADQAYKKASLLVRAGRDPFTGKPLKKDVSASDALQKWRLRYAKEHGFLPRTGPPPKAKPPSASDALTRARLRYFRKHGFFPPTGPPSGSKAAGGRAGMTPTQVRSMRGKFDDVQHILGVIHTGTTQLRKNGPQVPIRSLSKAQILAGLRAKNYPEWAVKAATSIRDHGYVLPGIQRTMENVGLDPKVVLPKQYRRVPNRRPPTRRQARRAARQIPGLGSIGR
jgi:Putative peptidoglycan binding domain